MKKTIALLMQIAVVLVVTGCAVGNQYGYGSAAVSLPIAGSGDLGLAVVDSRSYVISGEKAANFVGIQRGGFGNPFNVSTASGNPLSEDFADTLAVALMKSGFTVNKLSHSSNDPELVTNLLASEGAKKNVILVIREWKTDSMMKFRLIFDLHLLAFDATGNKLGEARLNGDEVLAGAGFESKNSNTAVKAFERKIGFLFDESDISSALSK